MPERAFDRFGYGRDDNPDLMSMVIYSWVALELHEGVHDFDWLRRVLDRLHESGISVLLATSAQRARLV